MEINNELREGRREEEREGRRGREGGRKGGRKREGGRKKGREGKERKERKGKEQHTTPLQNPGQCFRLRGGSVGGRVWAQAEQCGGISMFVMVYVSPVSHPIYWSCCQ